MDTITMISSAVKLLAAYFSDGAQELSARLGEAAFASLRRLHDWIGQRLGDNPAADRILRELRERPADESRQAAIQAILAYLVEGDEDFARQLDDFVQSISAENPSAAGTWITASGAVAVDGDVRISGHFAAGRDLHHRPEPDVPPPGTTR